MAGDTTTGLAVVEKCRRKFPTDKDLINYELNIYLKQNKQDVLLKKIGDALTNDPENSTLIYVRGNIYDRYASDRLNASRKADEEDEKLSKKAKAEKVPANKAKLDNQAKKQRMLADSLLKDMRTNAGLAEADYKKT